MEKNPIHEKPVQDNTVLPQHLQHLMNKQLFLDRYDMPERGKKPVGVRPKSDSPFLRMAHIMGDHNIPLDVSAGHILTGYSETCVQLITSGDQRNSNTKLDLQ